MYSPYAELCKNVTTKNHKIDSVDKKKQTY